MVTITSERDALECCSLTSIEFPTSFFDALYRCAMFTFMIHFSRRGDLKKIVNLPKGLFLRNPVDIDLSLPKERLFVDHSLVCFWLT